MSISTYEATPVTMKSSVILKREQSTKKVKSEDMFALPVSEFKVPDDHEDDLPTFLPSQLDQVCKQLMQSGVDMADQIAPLTSVKDEEPSVSSPQIVCEENQDSTRVPMTDGNPESQQMLQTPDSIEPGEDASSTLESPPQRAYVLNVPDVRHMGLQMFAKFANIIDTIYTKFYANLVRGFYVL